MVIELRNRKLSWNVSSECVYMEFKYNEQKIIEQSSNSARNEIENSTEQKTP